ncbi:apolipoprotein N-acyltransferase [Thermodesulfobacteriota bacterium]
MKEKRLKETFQNLIPKLSAGQGIVLASSAALLASASFPRTGIVPLAWICLLPLLHMLRRATFLQAFLLGWLFGALHTLIICYWVFHAMYTNSSAGFTVSLLFTVFFVGGGIGLYLAAFACMARRVIQCCASPVIASVLIAALWVMVEYLRSHLFSGIPWSLLGYSQYSWTRLIQISDITGIYGVSGIIVFSNCMLFYALHKRPQYGTMLKRMLPAVLLLAGVLLYGTVRLQQYDHSTPKDADPVGRIAVIQASIPQDSKWRQEQRRQIITTHCDLTEQALQAGARLVFWPETAVPFYLQERLPERILQLCRTYNAAIVAGSPRYTGKAGSHQFYNAAFLITEGGISTVHDKLHLFPFGEYFPLGFIDLLKLKYSAPRQYTPGDAYTVFSTGPYRFCTLICFEILFPHLVRTFMHEQVDFMANLSNDAWFGRSSAHYQHFSMAVFRAVECRRTIVRASNTGISGFISPAGTILSSLSPFTDGFLLHTPVPCRTETAYVRYGDVFAWICFLSLPGVALRRQKKIGRGLI